ncbi:hypothetical protein DPEC_G00376880 [Dallia pectoralis]|nr:hypothetical protein DPEC_G00376880 [Dallia pectoralis]
MKYYETEGTGQHEGELKDAGVTWPKLWQKEGIGGEDGGDGAGEKNDLALKVASDSENLNDAEERCEGLIKARSRWRPNSKETTEAGG